MKFWVKQAFDWTPPPPTPPRPRPTPKPHSGSAPFMWMVCSERVSSCICEMSSFISSSLIRPTLSNDIFLTYAMLNKIRCHAHLRLLDPGCGYKFTNWMTNSADSDQLASEELTDLYLHSLQKQGMSAHSRTGVKCPWHQRHLGIRSGRGIRRGIARAEIFFCTHP